MDKMDVAGGRAYEEEQGEEEEEELDPAVEWRQAGDEQDVVEIALPGFRNEHVRVQVDNYGVLRVTGGRPAPRGGGRRWVRFTKDLRLPDGCDADGVRARFEDGRLIINLPIVADAAAGDAASTLTPLPRTSSFQPPSSVLPRLPPPPGKPNFFEPKLRPPLMPLSRPLPLFPATAFEPKPPPPPPPREPAPAPLFPSRPPPVPSTSFMSRPPPPPREPARLPSFPPPPPPPPAKPTFFDSKHWLPRRHPDHAAATAPEPTNPAAAAAERKPWAPPAIVPGPNTAEPEARSSAPPFPPRKQSTAVPEPKSPALSDIPIAMSSPSPPGPPPPPPRRRIPDANEKWKIQEGAGKVRLPLLEEMKKKEEKKMERRKAREAASGGSGTPPAVDEKREVTQNLLPLPSKDTATTTDLLANMAAAAAVLVGIALSVWRTMSSS